MFFPSPRRVIADRSQFGHQRAMKKQRAFVAVMAALTLACGAGVHRHTDEFTGQTVRTVALVLESPSFFSPGTHATLAVESLGNNNPAFRVVLTSQASNWRTLQCRIMRVNIDGAIFVLGEVAGTDTGVHTSGSHAYTDESVTVPVRGSMILRIANGRQVRFDACGIVGEASDRFIEDLRTLLSEVGPVHDVSNEVRDLPPPQQAPAQQVRVMPLPDSMQAPTTVVDAGTPNDSGSAVDLLLALQSDAGQPPPVSPDPVDASSP